MPTYFAIGDIHGRDDLLALTHADICKKAQGIAGKKILVHLGDYIDRGPHSCQVIERVMQSLPGFETVNLRGNHEQMMLDFLREPGPVITRQWLTQGGWETAASYGVRYSLWHRMRLKSKHDALVRAVPEKHIEWIANLPLIYRREEDGFVFVHAGISPERTLDEQNPNILLWIRRPFLLSEKDYGFRVVHGHTPSRNVDVAKNRVNLDAGAYLYGGLRYMMSDGKELTLFYVTQNNVQKVYHAKLS